MSKMRMRLGFVGLGNLGKHLAASLLRAGFPLTVHDRDEVAAEVLVAAGAVWASSPREVAAASDTVFTCLPSPRAVADVVTGERGLLEGLEAGGTWIDSSTNDRHELRRLAAIAEARGIHCLEAPVTGGLHLAASGQALMLARRAGLDLAQSFEVIKASSGNSFVHETESQVILNGSYNIGFTLDLACKDLGLAHELGCEHGVPLELGSLVERIFARARDEYGGSEWSPMVVKLL